MTPKVFLGLNIPTKKQYLKSIYSTEKDKAIAIREIVCNYFKVLPDDVQSAVRKRELVVPRQVCMYFIKLKTTLSLREIGGLFGNRDHSTVIYASNTVNDLIDTQRFFAKKIMEVDNLLIDIKPEKTAFEEHLIVEDIKS